MLGSQEMILIFIVVILLFGASKLPELARSMGKSVGEFKKAQRESELEIRNLQAPIKDVNTSEKIVK
jgi:sec-independent protein translocase protein TatA